MPKQFGYLETSPQESLVSVSFIVGRCSEHLQVTVFDKYPELEPAVLELPVNFSAKSPSLKPKEIEYLVLFLSTLGFSKSFSPPVGRHDRVVLLCLPQHLSTAKVQIAPSPD